MKTQLLEKQTRKTRSNEKFAQKEIECAYCQGTGKDPFPSTWPNSLCQVCRGRKRNLILFSPAQEKLKRCPFCEGSGTHPFSRMSCTICKGKGRVVIYKGWMSCPVCQGKGKEQEKAFECTRCGGKGELRL